MRRLLTLLGLITSLSTFAQNQGGCGTAAPDSAHFAFLESLGLNNLAFNPENDTVIRVPMKAHFLLNSSNYCMPFSYLMTAVCELNRKYEPSGIFFYLIPEINYIPFQTGNNPLGGYSDGSRVMSQNNLDSVVNVYFSDLAPIGLCGYAFYPNSGPGSGARRGGIMMGTGCSGPSNTTFAHEMGHYLSLPHPFDRTASNPLHPTNAELVTRSANEPAPRRSRNCATAGDRFCDTPSDYIDDRWNCNVPQVVTVDLNGDTIRPDASLYMSYSNDVCANRFSPQQMMAMRATFNSGRSYLRRTTIPAIDSNFNRVSQISPAEGDTIPANFAYFQWNAVQGADRYILEVSRSPMFNLPLVDTILQDTTFLYNLNRMLPGVTYRWRVRPINWRYTCSGTDTIRTFRAGMPLGASILSPEDFGASVYPTVLSNNELLNVNLSEEGQVFYRILATDGKVVTSGNLNQGPQTVGLSGFRSGVYLIQLERNGSLTRQKFIVR